jgi:hypothetical protein
MIEKQELLKKEGNSLVYTTVDGEVIKKFRKAWEANTDGCLDTVMKDFPLRNDKAEISNTVETTDEGDTTE